MLTPEERGPRPWWAYDSRDRLNLSDAEVAEAIPGPRRGEKYDPATIRKAETGEVHMSKPLWRKLTRYYTEVAREKGVALDPIPEGTSETQPSPDLATALRDLAAAVEDMRAEQAAWRRGIVEALAVAEGPARAALLAALVPRSLEDARQ